MILQRKKQKTSMVAVAVLAASVAGCSDVFINAIVRTGNTDTMVGTGADTEIDTVSDGRSTDGNVRQMDVLGRGVVAVALPDDSIYIGWRLLATDPSSVEFNIYRNNERINAEPIRETTDFVDVGGAIVDRYFVRSVFNGVESAPSEPVSVLAEPYRKISISGDTPVYRAGIGDLDGDGEYDVVLIRPTPLNAPQPSPAPVTFQVEGYRGDTRIWQIDLGRNIELGSIQGPAVVYDLDGDGISEIVQKTAEGTIDGTGVEIGDVNDDGITDYRDPAGQVTSGPEFLSVFDGQSGRELARTDWVLRGDVAEWGSNSDLPDHNFLGIAHLDGVRPSIIVVRGIAARQDIWAYDYVGGELSVRWKWSTLDEGLDYLAQGYHGLRTGDIDGDGRDEVLPGAYALDDDGTAMWSGLQGHGGVAMLTDIDPTRDGLELWYPQGISINMDELSAPQVLKDAATGKTLGGPEPAAVRVNRALAADIDPNFSGMELWGPLGYLHDSKGAFIGYGPEICNVAAYWDADPLRELVDIGASGGTDIFKWNYDQSTPEILQTLDGDLIAVVDLFGDWREEIVTYLSGELRIYTTVVPAKSRIVTLMQDPIYRLSVADETMDLLQPTQTGFYIGYEM